MESVDTLENMSAAVQATYSGLTTSGEANISNEHRETLSLKYSVWAQGGDSASVLRTIESWSQGSRQYL